MAVRLTRGPEAGSIFEKAFENSLVGIFTTDRRRVFLEVNPRAAEILGYRPEELEGRSVRMVHPTEGDYREFGERILAGFPETGVLDLQVPLVRKDGSTFVAEVSGAPLDGEVPEEGWVWVIRDISERKRAEAAVRESEHFTRTVISSVREGVVVYDRELRYRVWNPAMEELTGFSRDEVLGKRALDLFHHLREHGLDELLKRALAGETVSSEETPFCIPETGRSGWFRSVYSPHLSSEGEIIGVVAVIRDVTASREMRAELLEARQKYQSMVDHVGVGMALISPGMEILELNRTMREWFPEIETESRPVCFRSFNCPPRDEVCEYCPTVKTLSDGRLHEAVTETPTGEGIRRYRIVSTPILDVEGKVEAAIEMVQDVTEMQEAKEKTLLFRRLIDASRDAIFVLETEEGRFVDANHTACESLRYPREELLGLTLQDIETSYPDRDSWEALREKIREEEHILVVGTHRRRDGTTFPVEVSGTLVRYNGHETILAIARDITEWKVAQDELLATNQRLEEETRRAEDLALSAQAANRAKSEFLAKMSHEIRTPMNGVIGMTDLLLGMGLDDPQKECAETIRSSGEALLAIINDLLDFSRAEAGKLDLEVSEFGLRATLEEVRRLLEVSAWQKGLELVSTVGTRVPDRLEGDPGRLRQILTNLMGNAIKFSEEGEVRVDVDVLRQDDHAITLRFSVRDQGIGVPPEVQDRLFKPFEQGDGSLNRRYGGTGLGLSICRQLVELMEGEIGLESRDGEGSEFWFTAVFGRAEECESEPSLPSDPPLGVEGPDREASLSGSPVSRDSERADPPGGRDRRGEEHQGRILLAEDNSTNRQVAGLMVERLGYELEAAVDGEEALERLKTQDFDLVLMDVQMPLMNGLEATGAIRDPASGARNPRIPIVAMTAHAQASDREECLAAGMDDYVAKPIKLQALEEVLHRWMGRDGGADASDSGDGGGEPERGGRNLWDRDALLERVGGDPETADRVVDLFLAELPEDLEALRVDVETQDHEGVSRAAHSLKGAAGNVGAEALAEAARRLDDAAGRRDPEAEAEALDALVAEVRRFASEAGVDEGSSFSD